MSLEKVLAGLTSSSESTPTDVAMKLLDKDSAIMRTHIKNVRTMNKILAIQWYTRFKLGVTGEDLADFWQTLYDGNVTHMVSDKRKGEKAVVDVGKALMANMGMNPDLDKKGGLFGKK